MDLSVWLSNLLDWIGFPEIDKEALKSAVESIGLSPLWDVMRDLYLSPYYILLVIPAWLLISRLFPAARFTKSVRAGLALDFLYPLLSIPAKVLLIVYLIGGIRWIFDNYLSVMNTGLLDDSPILAQALGAYLITDFSFYIAHFLKHKIPWFWYFHTIHHSQRNLTPLTTNRNHPFEEVMDLLVRTIPIAIVGGSYPAWALFAFFDGMWGYYIHSSVRLSYGPLNYLIVTPQNHRLHHSIEPEHIDRNFGERLAIWDWIFGTLYKDFSVYPDTGVRQCERIEEQSARPVALCKSWFVQFLYPFLRIAEDAKRWAGWTGFVR